MTDSVDTDWSLTLSSDVRAGLADLRAVYFRHTSAGEPDSASTGMPTRSSGSTCCSRRGACRVKRSPASTVRPTAPASGPHCRSSPTTCRCSSSPSPHCWADSMRRSARSSIRYWCAPGCRRHAGTDSRRRPDSRPPDRCPRGVVDARTTASCDRGRDPRRARILHRRGALRRGTGRGGHRCHARTATRGRGRTRCPSGESAARPVGRRTARLRRPAALARRRALHRARLSPLRMRRRPPHPADPGERTGCTAVGSPRRRARQNPAHGGHSGSSAVGVDAGLGAGHGAPVGVSVLRGCQHPRRRRCDRR